MASKIKHKRSDVSGKIPLSSDLEEGQIALNTVDGKVFIKQADNSVRDITKQIHDQDTSVAIDESGAVGTIVMTADGTNVQEITSAVTKIKVPLIIEDRNSITIKEGDADSIGIEIKIPLGLTDDYDFVLPSTPGEFGQVLRTDGTGNLDWIKLSPGTKTIQVAKSGNDANDGINAPVLTLKRATQIASQNTFSPRVAPTAGVKDAAELLLSNIEYLQAEVIAYIEQQIASAAGGSIWEGFSYNDTIYSRNVGYLIESAAYDLKYTGNSKTVFTTKRYYNDIGSASNGQEEQAAAAITVLQTLSLRVIQNDQTGSRYQSAVDQVTDATKTQGSAAVGDLTGLHQITIDVLEQGINFLATVVDPQYKITAQTIQVSSGEYLEENPILIPDFCSIAGDSLRNCVLRPLNPLRDFLRIRDGVYFTQFTFRDLLDPEGRPQDRFDYAVAFDDVDDRTVNRFEYPELPFQKTLVTASPYIQNCSIISFLGANGIYNDGFKVRSPNIPRFQDEVENPPIGDKPRQNPSIVANAFTMLSFGGTGWRVTNEAYSQVVSCFQIFCKNGSYAQNGGYLSITNSATNFGLYALRSSGFRPTAFNFDKGIVANNGIDGGFTTFSVIGFGRSPVEHFILRFINSNNVDITENFKGSLTTFNFDPDSSVVDLSLNTFTVVDHGFINGSRVQYEANGNNEIAGLLSGAYYYVEQLSSDVFRLYEDEALTETTTIDATALGTHQLIVGSEEYYVEQILSQSNRYQILTLSGSNLDFTVGQEITGTAGAAPTSAYVYSWDQSTNTLVVSLNQVTIGNVLQYVDFTSSSTISQDAGGQATDIPVSATQDKRDLYSATFRIKSSLGGSTVANVAQTVGLDLRLHRPSIVNSSAHTWEYAGSGTDYNALPSNGGQSIERFEQFEDLPGRVYASGTNELGDFKVGNFIRAENRTGNVIFANRVSIARLDSISLSLSDVTISQISKDPGLGDNEPGGASHDRLTTQLAQRLFMDNRLGDFLDKRVATSAVPGAVVQLNSSGQLNVDVIPPTRAFNSYNLSSFEARLELVDDIPPQEVLSGDIVIEVYQQQSIIVDQAITVVKGDRISQASSGSEGFVREAVTSATSVVLVNVVGEFIQGSGNTLEINGTEDPVGLYVTTADVKAEFQENFFLSDDGNSQFLQIGNPQGGAALDFTVGATVTSAANRAQGQITNFVQGLAILIDAGALPNGSGYSTSGTYLSVALDSVSGSGTGAIADITVSAGQVSIIDLRRGGAGYVVGDTLTVTDDAVIGGRSGGNAFTVGVTSTENRLYVDITGNFIRFAASDTRRDYIAGNNAPVLTTNSLTSFNSISFNGDSSNGEIDYNVSYIIVPGGHGFTNGDPIEYDNNGNASIGGLSQLGIFYVKVINSTSFEVYTRYDLSPSQKVDFTTSQLGTHIFRKRTVSLSANRIVLAAHGFSVGDPVRLGGADLPTGLVANNFYYVGSLTTNSFTLHDDRGFAVQSINGIIQSDQLLSASVGTGTATFTLQNVEITGTTDTSSRELDNYSSLSATNIDAANIVSGTISPSRLASGAANTSTFLRGDSVWVEAVSTIRINSGSPLNLVGNSNTVGSDNRYYGDLRLEILPTSSAAGNADYTNIGVSAFNKSQFTVSAQGEVDVTSSADGGTLDAATLGGSPSSFFINPENLNRAVPINKGGTNIQSYNAGDIIFAAAELSTNTDSMSRLPLGVENTILTSISGSPAWSNSITASSVEVTDTFQVKDFSLDSETTTASSTSSQTVATFVGSQFRSAKMIVQVTNNSTGDYQAQEILVVHDGANVTADFVEYAIIHTSAAPLASFTATYSGGSVRLNATAATADSHTYKVVKTMITV